MVGRIAAALGAAYILSAAAWIVWSGRVPERDPTKLLNVACDPTRELWVDMNARFLAQHKARTGQTLEIEQSHGGSASQARLVMEGMQADVVTLAMFTDTDAVRKRGHIAEGWQDRLPNRSLPFVSTIVMVVRRGNPKGIRDWPDLARPDVRIVTPNPKTSGNGKWSFLAMWAAVVSRGGSEAEAEAFVAACYRNAPILDTSARAATMTFAQKSIGDVHLTWENEAHYEVGEGKGTLEIVYPPISILAEAPVAVVDRVVDRKGTREVAEAYLRYLYTEEAQEIFAKHYYRPTHPGVRVRTAERFPKVTLVDAQTLGGDWDALQARFFAEGGVFDALSSKR